MLADPATRCEAIATIVATYREAGTLPATAAALGVNYRTLYRWDRLYPALRRALRAAGMVQGRRSGSIVERRAEAVREALAGHDLSGCVSAADVANVIGRSRATVYRWIERLPGVRELDRWR